VISRFATIHLDPEADREWFADRRRRYRFRTDSAGHSVIARRDGRVQPIALAPHPGLRGADDFVLATIFDAFARIEYV